MQRARTWMAAAALALLAGLLVPAVPAAAGSQPGAPTGFDAASSVHRTLNDQNEIVSRTMAYVEWDHPSDWVSLTCYYVRWRLAAKTGRQAGAWQPSEQGAIAPAGRDYYDIDGLVIGETYDFEIRSYSESAGAYSDWVTLNKTMTLASTDSSLSSLTLSSGTLSPAFDPQQWGGVTYTATVANSVASITVTPTANHDEATITVKGAEVASGTASSAISLATGPNYIQVGVAAEYGAYYRTYSLNVVRAGPAGSLAAPTGLTLDQGRADGKHVITLAYTLPTGATEAVLEYRQIKGAASAAQWSTTGVIDLTTSGGKIKTPLYHSVDYAVRVAGKNSSGTGAWATATFTAHTTPYWPLNVAVTSGDGSLVVSWDPPVDKGAPDATITSYAVRWRPVPDDPCCPWPDGSGQDVGDVETYTIGGLTNNRVYEVQVSAFNNLGGGIFSESVRATPAELQGSPPQLQQQIPEPEQVPEQQQAAAPEPLAKPGAVRDVQTAIAGTALTVTWSAPQDGGEPSQYVVRLKTPNKGKAKVKRVDADATSVTFGKVKAGTHTVYVRAKNDTGGGSWTNIKVTVP